VIKGRTRYGGVKDGSACIGCFGAINGLADSQGGWMGGARILGTDNGRLRCEADTHTALPVVTHQDV
jgi:hypothetical protein